MKHLILSGLLLASLTSLSQTPEDLANDILEFISGEPGKERDWETFRSWFTPTAQFTAINQLPGEPTRSQHFTLEEFVRYVGPNYENGFLEEQVRVFSTEFNGMAVVWQEYRAAMGEAKMRGINCLQMVKMNGSWKASSLMWSPAGEEQQIPDSPFDCD